MDWTMFLNNLGYTLCGAICVYIAYKMDEHKYNKKNKENKEITNG